VPNCFGGHDQPLGDLFIRHTTGREAQHVDLPGGEAGNVDAPAPGPVAGSAEDCLDRVGFEPTVAGLGAQLAGGILGWWPGAVGPRLDDGGEAGGGGEEAGRWGDGVTGRAGGVAGPVEPLAQLANDPGDGR